MQTPQWLKPIPDGSHGSGPIQKKVWKLVSDVVRIRDWYKYGGRCVSCNRVLQSWKDGQAAHYIGYTSCNNIFKWNIVNLALSCAICNKLSDGPVGYNFGLSLKRRGINIRGLHEQNKKLQGGKIYEADLLEYAKKLLETGLEEYPDYWDTVKKRLQVM